MLRALPWVCRQNSRTMFKFVRNTEPVVTETFHDLPKHKVDEVPLHLVDAGQRFERQNSRRVSPCMHLPGA